MTDATVWSALPTAGLAGGLKFEFVPPLECRIAYSCGLGQAGVACRSHRHTTSHQTGGTTDELFVPSQNLLIQAFQGNTRLDWQVLLQLPVRLVPGREARFHSATAAIPCKIPCKRGLSRVSPCCPLFCNIIPKNILEQVGARRLELQTSCLIRDAL